MNLKLIKLIKCLKNAKLCLKIMRFLCNLLETIFNIRKIRFMKKLV